MNPKTYREVLERYDRARAFGETKSLPEYAAHLNDIYQTDAFSEGLRDGPWTRASTRVDQYIEPIAGPLTGELGAGVGSLFGHEEAGRKVGTGLPRALAQTLPLYLLGPEAGIPATAAALGGTGLLFGGQTYADTGSAKAALISGGTAAAMPAVGGFAGKLGARAFGGEKVVGEIGGKVINEIFPRTAEEAFKVGAGRFAGSQGAQALLQAGSTVAQSRATGGNMGFGEAFTDPEFWLGQIPFTVHDAVKMSGMKVPTSGEVKGRLGVPTAAPKPFVPAPVPEAETEQLNSLLDNFNVVHKDVNSTPEMRAAAMRALVEGMNNPEGVAAVAQAKAQNAGKATVEAPVKLTGRVDKVGDSYRVLVDDIETPYQVTVQPGQTVFVNGAEPTFDPVTGRMVFETQIKNLRPARNGLSEADFGVPTPKTDVLQPELAVQPPPEGADPAVVNILGNELQRRVGELRAKITTPEKVTLAEMGAAPEQVETMATRALNDPHEFVPAIKVGGVEVRGNKGDTHKDILDRYIATNPDAAADALVDFDTKENPNYFLRGDQPVSREELKQTFGVQDSQGLKRLQESADSVVPVKQAVMKYEQAKSTEESARESIAAVPTKPEEWIGLTSASWGPLINRQTISAAAVMMGDGSVYTGPMHALAREAAREAGNTNTKSVKYGYVRPDESFLSNEDAFEQYGVGDSMQTEARQLSETQKALDSAMEQGATPTQAVEKVRLQDQTTIVDESSMDQEVQTDVVHKTTSEGIYGEQGEYGPALKDELGNRRIWRNPAEADEFAATWKLEHPEDESRYVTRNDGRGFYYLAPKENIKVQFDAGDAGTGMENLLESQAENLGRLEASESELMETPVEGRAEVSRQSMLTALDVAARNAETFAEFVDPDIVEDSPENLVAKARVTLQKGTEGLESVNAELKTRGIEPFKSMTEMTTQMKELLRAAGNFQDRYRNVTLKSVVPGDETAARAMRMHEGVAGLAAHIASVKEMGPVADIMEAIVNSGVLPKDAVLLLPGMKGHDSGDGFWMSEGLEGILPAQINIPYYPESVNDPRYLLNAAHEIVHATEEGLAQRTDPAAVEYRGQRDKVLEALRNTKNVPAKVRNTVAKLVKENAYAKLVKGTLSPEELRKAIATGIGKENKELFSYVYAMLSPREMIATLFSDPRLIAIAEATPMPKSAGFVDTALTWLSKAFNRLIGGAAKTETALSSMLRSYDNYLTGGVMRKVYNGAKFVRDSLVETGVRPDALASRMQTVDRTFVRGTLDASVAGFQREAAAGTLPATAKVGELSPEVLTALRAPEPASAYDSTMNLLADQLPQHQELLQRMREDIRVTDALVKAVESGEVPGSLAPGVKDALGLSRAKLNSMEKAMRKQELALARWNNLDTFDPQGWEQRVGDGLRERIRNVEPPDEVPDAGEIRKLVGIEKLQRGVGAKASNWLAKTFMLTQHLKELIPETRPIISGVNDEQGKAHARAVMLNGAFNYDANIQNVSKVVKASNERVAESTAMSEAASDLFRWQNKEGAAQGIDMRAPEVVKILSRFNDRDRGAIMQLLRSQWQRHHVWADNVLPPALGEVNRDNTALLIAARETGMLPEQARGLSTQLYQALRVLGDPAQPGVGAEMIRQLAGSMQPQTFAASLKHAQTLSENTANWIKRIRDNPGYTTEQRYGSDKLVMLSPKGDKFMTSGDQGKLQKIQSQKASEGYTLLDYIRAEDERKPSFGMREDTLSALDQLDAQNETLVAELLKDQPETAARILPRIQRAGDVRAAIAAGSPFPAVKRRFVEGREYLNLVDNANQFYVRMNNWLRNKATRSRTQLDMMHPQIEGNTEVRNLMDQHVNNFLSPDNPLAQKIVSATYAYKLGFDVGNAMLESAQNLTTGMAALIGETGSVGDAFGLWGNAVKELISHGVTKKWSNPEHARVMELAQERGYQGLASWSDIADPDSGTMFEAGSGNKVSDTLRYGLKKWAQTFSRHNDQIALLAAFDIAKGKGMDFSQAFDFAVDVKNRGLFNAGKSQRPIGLWSIKSKPVPQLLSALQTYSLGWFSQMAENYRKGFGKAPEGLTATQRLGAKKAFVYSIIAQSALAGALGLPGVGQGLALLGQATDTDPKGWLRQNLSKLFSEDQEAGGVLTSLALRGVGSAGLPFDPSSRASVSVPFLGVDAYKGFDVANLGGAATSTVGDFVEGMLAMLRGDPTGGGKLLPNVAKRPYQLWQGEGDIRDKRGGLMVELSPGERFAMAVGVTPSRVQTQRDSADALNKANRAAQRQKEAFVDELANLQRKGKTAEVQQAIIAYIRDNPGQDAKELVRAIASRVEAQTVPYDWRRDLNPGVELAGLNTPQPSTELARRRLREQVAMSLGVPMAANPMEDYRASLVDSLLDSDSLMSRPAARRAVSGRPAIQSPYGWLSN